MNPLVALIPAAINFVKQLITVKDPPRTDRKPVDLKPAPKLKRPPQPSETPKDEQPPQ